MEFNETMKIKLEFDKSREVREIVASVYEALKIKGYDPISQMVGYILSGDPTYITSYNGARGLITKFERDELLEEFVKNYGSFHMTLDGTNSDSDMFRLSDLFNLL